MATVAVGWAARARWLPATGLLLALSSLWLFAGDRGVFTGHDDHDWDTGKNMAIAANFAAEPGFMFLSKSKSADGSVRYRPYNRFPVGAFALTWLAIAPFDGDLSSQLAAARTLMLAFFCGAVALAYLALARLLGNRAIAVGATLLAFSSYYPLFYSDAVSNEASVDLFAVMLVFHAMVLFKTAGGDKEAQRRRFLQLAIKTCAALLLGWHVYGLLLPFLVFGVALEAASAWRSRTTVTSRRLATTAASVLRGRSARLGALALLFGVGVLGHNIAQEYAALDGRKITELPSVQSALQRTGLGGEYSYAEADRSVWTILKWQIRRIGVASVPFALLDRRSESAGSADQEQRLSLSVGGPIGGGLPFWIGICGILGALAGLAVFKGPRSPPAALMLAGFGWSLLAPNNVNSLAPTLDHLESLFHVGFPLGLFAAALCAVRRLWGRSATAVCAGGAVAVFAMSSAAMSARLWHAPEDRARQIDRMAEFDAIAETARGAILEIAIRPRGIRKFVENRAVMNFLVAGSFARYQRRPTLTVAPSDPPRPPADFVLAFERYAIPALLTPNHRKVFLYEGGASYDAVLRAMHNAREEDFRRLRERHPAARAVFDIHIRSHEETGWRMSELVYLKSPCRRDDLEGVFYMHLYSQDPHPRWHRHYVHSDFGFFQHGWMLGDKCMMTVPVPPYGVAYASAGQFRSATDKTAIWQTTFRLDLDRLRGLLLATRDEVPAARGKFDLYLRDRELRYVRASCGEEDVRRPFFLHVAPREPAALPPSRRRHGFDNLDFRFRERGALIDGACVASATLPDYAIASLRTGQIDDDGVAWQAEFAPDRDSINRS